MDLLILVEQYNIKSDVAFEYKKISTVYIYCTCLK